jgi:hypothetical protein
MEYNFNSFGFNYFVIQYSGHGYAKAIMMQESTGANNALVVIDTGCFVLPNVAMEIKEIKIKTLQIVFRIVFYV